MAIDYRTKIVTLALSQVGTVGGKATGDDKYINYYNKITGATFSVSTTPWCAIFCTYIIRNCDVPTSICPNFAGCTHCRDSFLIPKGIWKKKGTYTPQPADLIFFDWKDTGNNKLDHVGLVIEVKNGKVYTVEGNSQGGYSTYGVRHKSYDLNSKYIKGYGAINYEGITGNQSSNNTKPVMPSIDNKKIYTKKFQTWMNTNYKMNLSVDGSFGPASKKAAIKVIQTIVNKEHDGNLDIDGSFGPKSRAAVPIIRRGSKGNIVYVAQGILYAKGYNPNGFDGSFGPGMDTVTRNYQRAAKLSVDGEIGPNTWYKLTR